MSIELSSLPPEELMLLSALEGMCGQYGFQPSAKTADTKAEAVLKAYGLLLDEPDYETTTFFILDNLAKAYKEGVGYWESKSEWKGDRKRLNRRSEALLVLLAGMSYGILGVKGGDLQHSFMSAGEAACFQLAAYSLLIEAPFGGYRNDTGHHAAALAMSDTSQPLDDSTFEHIE